MSLHQVLNNLCKKSRNKENNAPSFHINVLNSYMSSVDTVCPHLDSTDFGEGPILPGDRAIHTLKNISLTDALVG